MSETFDPYYKWLGIPPDEQPPHYYRLLAIRVFEADPDVISGAADQRMLHVRSFQTGEHSAISQKILNEITVARICLLNPEKKAEYDNGLRRRLATAIASAQPPPPAQYPNSVLTPVSTPLQPGASTLLPLPEQEGFAPVACVSRRRKQSWKLLAAIGAVALLCVGIAVVVLPGGDSGQVVQVEPSTEATAEPDDKKTDTPPSGADTATGIEKPAPDDKSDKGPRGKNELAIEQPGPTAQETTADVTPEQPESDTTLPATNASAEPSTSASEPPTPTVKRLPVPSATEQKEMIGQFNEVYKFSQRRTVEELLELAKRLFQLGKESQGGPVEKFVCFQKTIELAGKGGDAKLMLEAVDAMSAQFDVNALECKQKVLAGFISEKPEAEKVKTLIDAADPVIDDAIDAGRHDIALGVAETVYRLTQKPGHRGLRKRAFDRRNEVRKLAERFKELLTVRKTLKMSPDDPAANLAMGRWLYSQRGDWERALPHLTKSSSPAMKAVAIEELGAPPSEPAAQVTLGDAWWALAEKVEGTERASLQLHAGDWYGKAKEQLPKGFVRDKVESRLAEIARIGRPALKQSKRTKTTKFPKEFALNLGNRVKMEFVLIPAGEFMMGSSEAQQQVALNDAKAAKDKSGIAMIPIEGPQHRVKITKPFYLGKYEVTQAQWQTVIGSNPSKFKGPNSPVEQVSWNNVQPFLEKLNKTFGNKGKFGLPTEAQWEYACRAGTTTAFAFGDNAALLMNHGWFKGNSGRGTHPVGQGKPNAWGLFDMHGNVLEWCADWCDGGYYAQSPPVDPVGPSTGSYRVIRGGSYFCGAGRCRSALRGDRRAPGYCRFNLGFRVALVPAE